MAEIFRLSKGMKIRALTQLQVGRVGPLVQGAAVLEVAPKECAAKYQQRGPKVTRQWVRELLRAVGVQPALTGVVGTWRGNKGAQWRG